MGYIAEKLQMKLQMNYQTKKYVSDFCLIWSFIFLAIRESSFEKSKKAL